VFEKLPIHLNSDLLYDTSTGNGYNNTIEITALKLIAQNRSLRLADDVGADAFNTMCVAINLRSSSQSCVAI
jgi:hypothetical protein